MILSQLSFKNTKASPSVTKNLGLLVERVSKRKCYHAAIDKAKLNFLSLTLSFLSGGLYHNFLLRIPKRLLELRKI